MDAKHPRAATRAKPAARSQDPEGTRANIIEIASEEFARYGLAGARIDEIADRTRSSKRMIYYYFGDKEGLYVSCLENAYRVVRDGERRLDVEGLKPLEALRKLVEFTFEHHRRHENFIRMVMTENLNRGEYLDRSPSIRELNSGAVSTIEAIYRRGVAEGLFRDSIEPIDLHWQISALCFFNVSNRATFSRVIGRDVGTAKMQAALRRNTVEMVLRFVVLPGKLPD